MTKRLWPSVLALWGCGAVAPAEPASIDVLAASSDRGLARPGGGRGQLEPLAAPAQSGDETRSEGDARDDEEPGRFEALPVEGFLDAVVWVPPTPASGPASEAPVVVVAHGAGGRPEPHCQRWRELLGERGFVLCTRGRVQNRFLPPDERGYFYDGHGELGRETLAALDALESRYGRRADTRAAVYAGYSQGATMGALFLHTSAEGAARFPRVVLVEGGSGEWNVPLSERFRGAGGQRVLFVCGQKRCRDEAERSAAFIGKSGLEVHTRYAAGAGHTYLGEVGRAVEQELAWVLDGDPRWRSH